MAETDAADPDLLRPETWHPTVRGLYDHWLSIHPAVGLPGRQHVDPGAIPQLLPHVFMVDVCRGPLRFRYRLVGTEYVHLMGRDLTGRYLDEVHPGFHGLILRQYVEAAEQRRPGYRKGPVMYARPDRRYLGMERVILPLARNGSDVDVLLGAIAYIPALP
ncbi:MAG TPA: PAS domain-containing protein [Stellaceae bacterium]